LKTWLAGVLDGAAARATEAEPAVQSRSARATPNAHLNGLIVIWLRARGAIRARGPPSQSGRAATAHRTRTAEGGEICVLPRTNAEGTEFAASRLYQPRDARTAGAGVTVSHHVQLADDSVTDILARAEHDAKRRTGGHE
jgi:hypothetical protein